MVEEGDRTGNSPSPVQSTPSASSQSRGKLLPGLLMGLGFMIAFLILKFSILISLLWGLVGGVASWWIETSWQIEEEVNEEARGLPTDLRAENNSLSQNRTKGEKWRK
jgi:hypothetical protein